MASVDHVNVLKVFNYGMGKFVSNPSQIESEWLYLAVELAQEHTLFDYLVKTGPFPEKLAAHCFK